MAVGSSELRTRRAARVKHTKSSAPSVQPRAHAGAAPTTTVPLHRRLFFPNSPPPHLLSSESFRELDAPIYELLALICRAHILPWYGKITRDTRPFLLEVVRLATYAIRRLERRLEEADLVRLLTVELPNVVERHLRDFEVAKERSLATGVSIEEIYQALHPHPAIRPCTFSGSTASTATNACSLPPPKYPFSRAVVSPTYLRNIAEAVLQLLLPEVDFDADAERHIVRELFVNVALATLFYKVAQPWFLHQAIAKALPRRHDKKTAAGATGNRTWSKPDQLVLAIWSLLLRAFALFASLPSLLDSVRGMLSPPSRATQSQGSTSGLAMPSFAALRTWLRVEKHPQAAQAAFIAEAALLAGRRHVDNLVVHLLYTRLLTVNGARGLLDTIIRAAFPLNGYPAPSPPDPLPPEWSICHDEAVAALTDRLPSVFVILLTPATADADAAAPNAAVARDFLEPLGEHVCNVHLFLSILDCTLAALFPELVASTSDDFGNASTHS